MLTLNGTLTSPSRVHLPTTRKKRNATTMNVSLTLTMVRLPLLIFSMNGGMGKEAGHFLRALANLLAEKNDEPNAITMNWLRTKISFALTRSIVTCVRGTRTFRNKVTTEDINVVEATSYNRQY